MNTPAEPPSKDNLTTRESFRLGCAGILGLVCLFWFVQGGVYLLQQDKWLQAGLTGVGAACFFLFWFSLLSRWSKSGESRLQARANSPNAELKSAAAKHLETFAEGEIHPLEAVITLSKLDPVLVDTAMFINAVLNSTLQTLYSVEKGAPQIVRITLKSANAPVVVAFTREELVQQSGLLSPIIQARSTPMTQLIESIPSGTGLSINLPRDPAICAHYTPEFLDSLRTTLNTLRRLQQESETAKNN